MTDRRLKVLALSPIPEEGAGCRFRVAQYIPYLREAGFDGGLRWRAAASGGLFEY